MDWGGTADKTGKDVGEAMGRAMVEPLKDKK